MKFIFTLLLSLISVVGIGQNLEDKYEKLGQIYSDSNVLMFIPKDYKPQGRKINFVVWLRAKNRTAIQDLTEFQLPEQLIRAEVSSILIIPKNPFREKYSLNRTLKKMGKHIQKKQQKSLKVNLLALAGFDSGGMLISKIARKNKNLNAQEIWLFHTKINYNDFSTWLSRPRNRFLNVYTKDYEKNVLAFTQKMQEKEVKYANMKEEECTLGKLEQYPVVHIQSSVLPDKTPYLTGNFYKFLLTSLAN